MRARTGVFFLAVAAASALVYAGMRHDGGLQSPRVLEWASLLMWMPGLCALACLRLERVSWKSLGWDPGPGNYLIVAAVVPIVVHAALLASLWAAGFAVIAPSWLLSNLRRLLRIPLIVPFTLGEELGWRGYLQPRLCRRLGPRAGIAALGLIWGYWHFPLIWLGYNFPRHPRLGAFLIMPLICLGWAGLMGWLYQRSKSLWAPTIAHASVNASFWMLAELPAAQTSWIELVPVAAWLVIGTVCLLNVNDDVSPAEEREDAEP